MEIKESLKKLRGWFPQEPKVSIIRSANIDLKPGRWVPLPSISGILLIVAALLSIYFGSIFSQSYNSSYYINYSGLPIAVLHLAAVGLELFSAALLLTKKYTTIAVAGMVVVLLLGLSIPLVGMLDQPTTTGPGYFRFVNLLTPAMWMNGLFLGSPMIAFSAAGLIIAWLNQRKMQGPPGFNAKAAVVALAVFWSIIAVANFIQTNALINRYPTGWLIHSPLAVQVISLLGGAALGAVIGIAITRLQLRSLPNQTKVNSRFLRWLLVTGAAAAAIFLFTGFLSIGLSSDTEFVLLNSIFGCAAAVFFARAAIIWRFEKRQNISVRQNGLETFTLPKEPLLIPNVKQGSKGPILLNFKSVVLSSIVVAGFAGLIFVLSNSWIRLVLLAAAILGCIITLAVKGKFRRVAKYTVVSLMIFCLCFTAYEGLTFSAVGGEPVLLQTADLTMDRMGNLSITKMLDGIENGSVGGLLKLEGHELGTPNLIDIRLAQQGHVTIYYTTKNVNESVDLYSSNGYQFSPLVYADYSDYRNVGDQYVRTSLCQVDALGLQRFYNQALEIAHNRTATLHSIDTVVFSLNYNTNTEGLSVGVSAMYSTPGSNYYPSVVAAAFYPNGTLISMTTPREVPIA